MINRIYEYEEQVKHSLGAVIEQISYGDVMGQVSYNQSVNFEHDKLQSIDDVSHSSIGCRVFNDGKKGKSTVNSPNNISQMIANAYESSLFGEKINISLPKATTYENIDWLYSPKNIEFSKKDLKDIAESLVSEIKKFAPKAKVSTSASNSCSSIFLQNSEGFVGECQGSSLGIHGGLFELSDDGSFLEMYEGEAFYDNVHNFDEILKNLQERVERSRQTSLLKKEGSMPVIIAPSAMDMILTPIEIASNGNTLYKELSLFANRIDEEMFDKKFSFIDDPFYYHGVSTVPFDNDGVVGKKMSIIEEGVFKNFIYDCETAAKMNTHSTGHGSRSFTNRIIGLGQHTLDEMISSVDYGLMLVMPLGEGQSNVIAGDFSVLAETAFLIENGQLKGKVKDIMLSGNSFELLKNIPMIENKHHKEHSLITPHILLNNIKVSKNI